MFPVMRLADSRAEIPSFFKVGSTSSMVRAPRFALDGADPRLSLLGRHHLPGEDACDDVPGDTALPFPAELAADGPLGVAQEPAEEPLWQAGGLCPLLPAVLDGVLVQWDLLRLDLAVWVSCPARRRQRCPQTYQQGICRKNADEGDT